MSLVLFSLDQKVGFGKYAKTCFSSLLDWPVTRDYIRWMLEEDIVDLGFLSGADQKKVLDKLKHTEHEDEEDKRKKRARWNMRRDFGVDPTCEDSDLSDYDDLQSNDEYSGTICVEDAKSQVAKYNNMLQTHNRYPPSRCDPRSILYGL